MIRRLLTGAALGAALMLPRAAHAFCGFYVGGADTQLYNNATQVAMLRAGTRTVLSMQNNYQGPPSKFAMIVPVPVVLQKENVKTLPRDIFTKLDALTAPRLVEYWEQDPCYQPANEEKDMAKPTAPAAQGAVATSGAANLGVKIEAQFTVGEYEILILSAEDSTGLDKWLRLQKYNIPAGAEPFLRPYVAQGSKFFVAKVDPEKVTFKDGMATLSPLRFHYDADTFSLPIRLGLINASDAQDLIVNILAADQRYEVSNYKNVTIPTNFDVGENARAQFGAFYASLFDRTLEANPKAVVTEYAWQASTCDPCPGPAMFPSDFATLGADVAPSKGTRQAYAYLQLVPQSRTPEEARSTEVVRSSLQGQTGTAFTECAKKMKSDGGGNVSLTFDFNGNGSVASVRESKDPGTLADAEVTACIVEAAKKVTIAASTKPPTGMKFTVYVNAYTPQPNYVVTRLHARYNKESLGEDLVFKTAPPIQGGREMNAADGKLEHGAVPSSMNNFQGRYAIRHPWTGPITCTSPRRGIWGGPPAGAHTTPPQAARDLAFAPRKGVQLASFVRGEIPELKVNGNATSPQGVSSPDAGSTAVATAGTASPARPVSGCGSCNVGSPAGGTAAMSGLAFLLAAVVRRRRDRR